MSPDFYVLDLVKHSDPRGTLFEILRFKDQHVPGEGYIYTFSINPGHRRGDHYHTHKEEWFTCVYGKAIIFIERKDGEKKKLLLDADKPVLVYCGPYTAHALLNETDTPAIMVSYGSKQHDPEDEDTHKKFIEI